MTKEEYLALAASRYEALQALEKQNDFYAYEQEFDQLWTDLGRAVLERSIGAVPNDKRKKTSSAAATVA